MGKNNQSIREKEDFQGFLLMRGWMRGKPGKDDSIQVDITWKKRIPKTKHYHLINISDGETIILLAFTEKESQVKDGEDERVWKEIRNELDDGVER